MKTFLAVSAAVLLGVVSADDSSAQEYMVQTNRSPKKQEYAVWDTIMVRGANGQLQPWSEHEHSAASSATCLECQKIVRYVGEALKDGELIEKYKGLLEMLCGYLPADKKQTCLEIVDDAPALIKEAEKMVEDPRAFCLTIDLCGEAAVPRAVRFFVRYMAARVDNEVTANDVVCDECMFAANELKAIVEQKASEEEVKAGIEGLCSYLGGSTARECVSIVDQYFPLLWDELVALISDSRGLCKDLGMCQNARGAAHTVGARPMLRLTPARTIASGSDETTLRYRELPSRQTPRLTSATRFLQRVRTPAGLNAACVLCEVALGGVVDFYKANPSALGDTVNLIKENVCNEMASYRESCDEFLSLYLQPVLLNTLEQINPEEWCAQVVTCPPRDVARLESMSTTEKATVVCQACTVVAELLQHELGDAAIQADIIHEIETVCDDLPKDITDQCKSLLETYGPSLFTEAAQQLNPMVACPAMHLCPERRAAMAVKVVKPSDSDEM